MIDACRSTSRRPGPVAPEVLGSRFPHEHTRCVLWQIPDRWDYWELTGEDDLILPELARSGSTAGRAWRT